MRAAPRTIPPSVVLVSNAVEAINDEIPAQPFEVASGKGPSLYES